MQETMEWLLRYICKIKAQLSHPKNLVNISKNWNKLSDLQELALIIKMGMLNDTLEQLWAWQELWWCMQLFIGPTWQIQLSGPCQFIMLFTCSIIYLIPKQDFHHLTCSLAQDGHSSICMICMFGDVQFMYWKRQLLTARRYHSGNQDHSDASTWEYHLIIQPMFL